MMLSLTTNSLTKGLSSPPPSSTFSTPSSYVLHGHEALITAAAVRGASSVGASSGAGLFATADAAGRCLVWQYRSVEDTRIGPSSLPEGDANYMMSSGDVLDLGDWISSSSPCHHVCALHTSTGAGFLDISFMPSVAHPALLVGAQGDQQVSLWDITQGTCVQHVHRWMDKNVGEGNWRERMAKEGVSNGEEQKRKRKKSEHRGASGLRQQKAPAAPPPPSPWPVINSVVPLPDFSSSGPHSFCFGGDDGCVAVYDIRSGVIEQTIRLGSPVTAIASAAGKAYASNSSLTANPHRRHQGRTPIGLSTRAEQLYVGDATGHVRWLDLRAGSRGRMMHVGGGAASSRRRFRDDDALATIWLGKTVVSDIIVSYNGGHRWDQEEGGSDDAGGLVFGEQNKEALCDMGETAVAITSGEETITGVSGEHSMVPTAVWMDMKPFASSDAERVARRLPLVSPPSTTSPSLFSDETANTGENEGPSTGWTPPPRGWFWRGEMTDSRADSSSSNHAAVEGSELVLPYCTVGSSSSLRAAAQLVHTHRFTDGAWRQLRRGEVPDATTGTSGSPSPHVGPMDRRVTRVLGERRNEGLSTPAIQVLATCGNEVVVYEG